MGSAISKRLICEGSENSVMAHIPDHQHEAAFPREAVKREGMNAARDTLLPAQWGLTKLEYAAIQIAAGICACSGSWPSGNDADELAFRAVRIAQSVLSLTKSND